MTDKKNTNDMPNHEELSEWAESLETLPPSAKVTKSNGDGAGRAMLEAALGSAEAVDRAIGRPSLSEHGVSPSRTLRFPSDLDAALVSQAQAEHRKPSELIREAVIQYLPHAP